MGERDEPFFDGRVLAAGTTGIWLGPYGLIGNSVVRETREGFAVVASCTTREAAEAAIRLMAE